MTIGKAAPLIEEALARAEAEVLRRGCGIQGREAAVRVARASSMDEAVALATQMANAIEGRSSVVLSPACASTTCSKLRGTGSDVQEAVRKLKLGS